MDKQEIENLIEEKAQSVFARNFSVFLEHLDDKFKLIQENFQMVHEKMDRGFAHVQSQLDQMNNNMTTLALDVHEIKEDLEQVKRNTDRNSLEIVTLQEKGKESWRRSTKY